MSVLGQVRRDGQNLDVLGQVFGPVVDEDCGAAASGKVRRQIATVGVTPFLREVAADEVIHPELFGPVLGVVIAAGAPRRKAERPAEVFPRSRTPQAGVMSR